MHYKAIKLPIRYADFPLLEVQSNACRFVFNWGLDKLIKHYKKTGKLMSAYDLQALLTKLKDGKDYAWLRPLYTNSLQISLHHLGNAVDRMLKYGAGFPKFKSRFKSPSKFTVPARNGVWLQPDGRFRLGKLREAKVNLDQPIPGRLLSITCKKEVNGRWYASFLFECEDHPALPKTGKSIGLDMGSIILAAGQDSTGKKGRLKRHEREAKQLAKIKRHQKSLARKKKGSNRYNRHKRVVAKSYFKLRNQRSSFNHCWSKFIVDNYDNIFIEDLNVKEMMRVHNVAKGFQQASIGDFLRKLEYKSEWYGKKLIRLDPWRTSKTCSVCGSVSDLKNQQKRAHGRFWECKSCGTTHERDENAATNILNLGLVSMRLSNYRAKRPSMRNNLLRWAMFNGYHAELRRAKRLVEPEMGRRQRLRGETQRVLLKREAA